jgi:hypothetical protein
MTDDQRVDYLVDIHTQLGRFHLEYANRLREGKDTEQLDAEMALLEEREMHLHDGHTGVK